MTKLTTGYIGSVAQHSFTNKQTASIMGNTSRGIFLKTVPKWVIFLSYESFRGPLTLNLVGDVAPLQNLQIGEKVHVSPQVITTSGGRISIGIENAHPWGSCVPQGTPISGDERLPHTLSFIRRAHQQANGVGLSGLFPSLAGDAAAGDAVAGDAAHAGNHPHQIELLTMKEYLEEGRNLHFLQSLNKLLGRGGGLTPSWDDFTMGLLLTLNRWRHAIPPKIDLDELNAEIVKSAYGATTTISANLIECAAGGLADERLVAAVDYLMTGVGEGSWVLDALLGWGSSSGVDALLGMAVAILSHHHFS